MVTEGVCWIMFTGLLKKTGNLLLPDLSFTGSVGALIESIKSICQLCFKLYIQEILLPTAENPGRKNAYLLVGRVVKNWENLKQKRIVKLISDRKSPPCTSNYLIRYMSKVRI